MFRHEDVFVKPGKGVKVPLRVPAHGGLPVSVPKEGRLIERDFHVERLITTGDLVVGKAPAEDAPADAAKPKG